jgi:Lipase
LSNLYSFNFIKGPGFEQKLYDGFMPISKTDARTVQVIHSSDIMGMSTEAGTIDFYPNGGVHQPGELER